MDVIARLKKLFPLSLKFATSGKRLVLGILLYYILKVVCGWALSLADLIITPIVALIFAVPCILIGIIPIVIGILLCLVLPPLGSIVIYIGLLPLTLIFGGFSILFLIAEFFVNAYVITGIVVMFLAYCGVFGELPKVTKKKSAEKKSTEDADDESVEIC